MNKCIACVVLVAAFSIPAICQAADVTLTADDAGGTSSFNSAGHWDSSAAPTAGNDYINLGYILRTPEDGNSYVFAGDSLTIQTDGFIGFKGAGTNATLTIDDLILDGGEVAHWRGTGDSMNLYGNINVMTDSTISAHQGPFNIFSTISGSASISNPSANNTGSMLTFFAADSTFDGDLINDGQFILAESAVFNFTIGADGVNNSVSGASLKTEFNGIFMLNLTAASSAIGDRWTLVAVSNPTYGDTFSMDGFTAQNGIWYKAFGAKFYVFSEKSGVLDVRSELPLVAVDTLSPANGEMDVGQTPTLTAVFSDVTETINESSVVMTIDDVTVPHVFLYNSPTSTVSHVVTTPFEYETPHTVKVIFSTDPGGTPFAIEWSFTVKAQPSLVYVDAVAGVGENTVYWDGIAWEYWNPPQNIGGGGDNLWEEEWNTDPDNLFGNLPSTSNSWFEAGREGAEDCRRLRTRISGLNNGTYEVYAYFWGVDGSSSEYLAVDLAGSAVDLPLYNASSSNVTAAVLEDFVDSGSVMVYAGNRTMYQIALGSVDVSNGLIDVFIDDVGDGTTVWYDGVGYKPVDGLTVDPDIQMISLSGGTATLTWDSESSGTYSILHKAALSDAEWTDVKTGITGGESITTDSVPVSGADTEFFRIRGQ